MIGTAIRKQYTLLLQRARSPREGRVAQKLREIVEFIEAADDGLALSAMFQSRIGVSLARLVNKLSSAEPASDPEALALLDEVEQPLDAFMVFFMRQTPSNKDTL